MAIRGTATKFKGKDIHTTFPYLERNTLYRTQKPFATDFIPNSSDAPLTNHLFDFMDLIVTDAQPSRDSFSLEKNGFCFLRGPTGLKDNDNLIDDLEYIERDYYNEIEALLHRNFPEYSRLECLDHQVRKRSPLFPHKPGEKVANAQPAVLPHSDFSSQGLSLGMEHFFPNQKAFYEGKDFDFLNVWRVLKGPNNDWPLAVCDNQTVNFEADVISNDVLHEDCVGENWLLYKDTRHAWYYLGDQDIEDVIVFRNVDSKGNRSSRLEQCLRRDVLNTIIGGFHAAFDTGMVGCQPRESIEVRIAAFR